MGRAVGSDGLARVFRDPSDGAVRESDPPPSRTPLENGEFDALGDRLVGRGGEGRAISGSQGHIDRRTKPECAKTALMHM